MTVSGAREEAFLVKAKDARMGVGEEAMRLFGRMRLLGSKGVSRMEQR